MSKVIRMDSVTLAHHLRVVADHYERNAAGARAMRITGEAQQQANAKVHGQELASRPWGQIAATYDLQAKQCRELADNLPRGMTVDGDELCVRIP